MLKMSNDEFVRDTDSVEESFHHDETSTMKTNNNESGLRFCWSEESIHKMVGLWRDRPLLYNTKHQDYTSKVGRRLALEEIAEEMTISVQELISKMVSLRTYYGSQHRKKIAWEKKGLSTYKSRWQFFDALEFLQDYMSQKPAESKHVNSEIDNVEDSDVVARNVPENHNDEVGKMCRCCIYFRRRHAADK